MKTNTRGLCLLALLMCSVAMTSAYAQQDIQYTQFMHNKLAINPAVAGSKGVPVFHALLRKQWFGLEGAPASQAVGFHTPLQGKNVGLGLVVTNDQIGFTRATLGAASYAYHVQLTDDTYLSTGVDVSVKQYSMDWTRARATEAIDASIPDIGQNSRLMANFGAGVLVYNEKFYAGVSVPRLLRNTLNLNEGTTGRSTLGREDFHAYAMAGAMLPLSEKLSLKPAALVKYAVRSPVDLDIHASLVYNQTLSIGATYRTGGSSTRAVGESIDVLLGVQATDRIRLGLSYDFTLSEIRRYSSGSGEIFLEYTLAQKQQKLTNPRFF